MPRRKRSSQKRVLLDAGPIIGLFNSQDEWHARCEAFFGQATFEYFTTQAVITEAIFKIQKAKPKEQSVNAVVRLLDDVYKGIYQLCPLDTGDFRTLRELRLKYRDQNLDFADLTLVVAADHLKIGKIVTIDRRDFELLRWDNGNKHFDILEPEISSIRLTRLKSI